MTAFEEQLMQMLGNIQRELGFTDEEMSCANGDVEIIAAIRKLKSAAEDYSKPLDVQWLCKDCHAKVHRIYQDNL